MKIFSAANPTEAHIICGLLESEKIACEVRGEGLFGLKGKSLSLKKQTHMCGSTSLLMQQQH